MADYEIGYGKPPKDTRFKKGQSGNPAGRRKKEQKPPDRSLAAMLKRIGEREIQIGGETFTLLELELLALHKKAARGDVAASKHLARMREEAGLGKANESKGGVLAVPMAVDEETFAILAERQQAKYRTNAPYEPDNLVLDPDRAWGLAFDALKDK